MANLIGITFSCILRNFNLADVITLCNGACGALSIFSNLRYLITHDEYYLWLAIWCIPFGFTFDVFDGRVARWRETSSILGQELDSLADAVSFNLCWLMLTPMLWTLWRRPTCGSGQAVVFVVFSSWRQSIASLYSLPSSFFHNTRPKRRHPPGQKCRPTNQRQTLYPRVRITTKKLFICQTQ